MSGVVCAKIIICGADAGAALNALTEVSLLRAQDYDDDPLTKKEFQEIIEFLEQIEEKGAALAKQIGKPQEP